MLFKCYIESSESHATKLTETFMYLTVIFNVTQNKIYFNRSSLRRSLVSGTP